MSQIVIGSPRVSFVKDLLRVLLSLDSRHRHSFQDGCGCGRHWLIFCPFLHAREGVALFSEGWQSWMSCCQGTAALVGYSNSSKRWTLHLFSSLQEFSHAAWRMILRVVFYTQCSMIPETWRKGNRTFIWTMMSCDFCTAQVCLGQAKGGEGSGWIRYQTPCYNQIFLNKIWFIF